MTSELIPSMKKPADTPSPDNSADKLEIDPQLVAQVIDCTNLCIFDASFTVYYSNSNFNKLIGYSKEEIYGKSLLDIKHDHQSGTVYDFLMKTLEKNITWKGELQLRHKNNYPLWMDTSIKPVITTDHKNRYIANFIDIGQRKKLIDSLKQRAHRQSLIAILGQISLGNIAINELLGQTLSVVCGSLSINKGIILELSVDGKNSLVRSIYNTSYLKPTKSILPVRKNNFFGYTLHSDRPVISESLFTENRFETPKELLKEHKGPAISLLIGDKKYPFGIFTLMPSNPHSFNADEISFLQSICNTMAEAINRKNMETALKKEQELTKKYLDVAKIIIIVIDKNNLITLANNHAEKILGYSKNDLLGLNFLDTFIPHEYKKHATDLFYRLFSESNVNSSTSLTNTIPIINKSHQNKIISWRSSKLYNDKNEVISVLSAGEDITLKLAHEEEQKQLEEKLNQAKKLEAIGILASGISHDFNNILSSILGFSDLALESINSSDTKIIKFLTEIKTSSIKARNIINQMQSINLQEETANKPILLDSLLKDTLKMLSSALPDSINLKLNIATGLPTVQTNSSKFNQMVMHLLTNARNALNGKGEINISLYQESFSETNCCSCGLALIHSYVVLSIEDNGPGLAREDLQEIFEDKSNKQSGLSFINQLLHQSQGHILILDNKSQSSGTNIQLLFDIALNEEGNEKHKLSPEILATKHIMIVNNENSVASFMGELFRGAGFKASVFCDAIEAMDAMKEQAKNYDLVIVDQTMPLMSGEELANNMLIIKPDLPIIICLEETEQASLQSNEDSSIKEFLHKPVDSAMLLHTVVQLLT